MKVAYIRSSSEQQNNEYQIKALESYNIEKYFIEKKSGKDTNRPVFKEMLEYIREGDIVYIYDFSRISRNVKDLLNIVDTLQEKKVELISIKENLDTSTSTGKLMLTMIGAINEFQRTNQREKQAEGIALAKEKGKYKGRKKIELPKNWDENFKDWRERKITATKFMENTGLKRATFYRLLKEYTENNK